MQRHLGQADWDNEWVCPDLPAAKPGEVDKMWVVWGAYEWARLRAMESYAGRMLAGGQTRSGIASVSLACADHGTSATNAELVSGSRAAYTRFPAAARITSATPRDLPAGLEELAPFDTVVLVNIPASAWKPEGQQALVDYVLAGGHLVIIDRPFTPYRAGDGRPGIEREDHGRAKITAGRG